MPELDLDAYCTRIDYRGARTPTLDTLRALHQQHPAVIPFEAIDVLLDRGIDVSAHAVDAKLIAGGRGGYCYEQNGLFKRVLQALGFAVEGLAARVHRGPPPDAPPKPRTHMALRVTIDDTPWLADVGFGGLSPTAPLRLDTTAPQPTRYETYRFRPYGDWLMLEAKLDDLWAPLYELSREPQRDVDYIPFNWYTSTHPDSHFRQDLSVARTTPAVRHTLSNNRFIMRTPDGDVEKRTLDVDEIEYVLVEVFGLPVEAAWRAVFERAVKRAAASGS